MRWAGLASQFTLALVLILMYNYAASQDFAETDLWVQRLCGCTYQYDPICGSDMRRYRNQCTFDCRLDYLRDNMQKLIEPVNCKTLPPASPLVGGRPVFFQLLKMLWKIKHVYENKSFIVTKIL